MIQAMIELLYLAQYANGLAAHFLSVKDAMRRKEELSSETRFGLDRFPESYQCRYHLEHQGTYQCPKCKNWFCEKCRELFLPIDPLFWVATAMMCPECHYRSYSPIIFE